MTLGMASGSRVVVENDSPRIMYDGLWTQLGEASCGFSSPDATCYTGGAHQALDVL